MCRLLPWCRERESNPHAPIGATDFKSVVSASSTIPASNQYCVNAEYSTASGEGKLTCSAHGFSPAWLHCCNDAPVLMDPVHKGVSEIRVSYECRYPSNVLHGQFEYLYASMRPSVCFTPPRERELRQSAVCFGQEP